MLPQFLWRESQLGDLFEDLAAPAEVGLPACTARRAPWPWPRATAGPAGRSWSSAGATRSRRRWPPDLDFFLGERVALLPEREADLEARAGRVAGPPSAPETGQAVVLVASVAAALPRTIGPAALEAAVVSLYPQRIVARDDLLRTLAAGGYRAVGQVTEPGEFAVRGGHSGLLSAPALAIRCGSSSSGTRSIPCASFDPETQRSLGPASR